MGDSSQINLWMGNSLPERFRNVIGLSETSGSEDGPPAPEIRGAMIVFVAHVPATVLINPVYRQGNLQAEHSGWMREGESGLFGTNAIRVHQHPDGDGILIIGMAT